MAGGARVLTSRALRARAADLGLDTEANLVELVLQADDSARADLRAQVLAPLDGMRPATVEKLTDTLRCWLLHQGRRDDVAAALFVHPQTVRYRMGQLRERYGDRLEDPTPCSPSPSRWAERARWSERLKPSTNPARDSGPKPPSSAKSTTCRRGHDPGEDHHHEHDHAASPHLAATTLVTACGLVGMTGSAQAAPAPERGVSSLADVLAADGHEYDSNWKDFDILDAAVTTVLGAKPDSPVAVLADGNVKLTAFAPTDRAFQRLGAPSPARRRRPRRRHSTRSPEPRASTSSRRSCSTTSSPARRSRPEGPQGRRRQTHDRAGREDHRQGVEERSSRWSTPTPTCATRAWSRSTSTRATRRSRTRSTGCSCPSTSDRRHQVHRATDRAARAAPAAGWRGSSPRSGRRRPRLRVDEDDEVELRP